MTVNNLLNVDQALETILRAIEPLPSEKVNIADALGRVLSEAIRSDQNLPPFANSSMDGYAVRAEDVVSASRETPACLRVVMDIPAGTAPQRPLAPGETARIMTGAPIPEGATAVIPVENTDAAWEKGEAAPLPAEVAIFKSAKPGDNVRPVGEDIQAGQIVLPAGAVLRPQDIGVLAGLGWRQVPVVRQPRVAILGTGNELADAGEPLTPGKIRDSNSYTLAGLVAVHGGIPLRLPIARDRLDEVRGLFHNALARQPDMIVSSAGVSVGAADLVRTVLDELGSVNFWRINLRPGKPLAFGQVSGVPFFGLPGNPVSAMVTFDVLVRPALLKMAGKTDQWPLQTVIVGEDMRSDGRRSYIRVKLSREDGQLVARPTGTQSSGALMSMVLADGLLIIPEDVTHVAAGTPLQVRLLRDLNR